MPPRTRSGDSASAAKDRVYTSGTTPKLQQARFPGRRKTVRGYGRKNPRRVLSENPDESNEEEETKSSPHQKTLTQMQWGGPSPSTELCGEEEVDARPVRSKKRRKTEGDVPSSPPSKRAYKTQTLTQMGSFHSNPEDDPFLIDHVPSDDDIAAKFSRPSVSVDKGKGKAVMGPPQTPSTRRIRHEIPSSQDSPITPMLARYSPIGSNRSPLKAKSTNVMSSPLGQFRDLAKPPSTSKRPRTLVVEDSFASNVTRSPASSVENHSPAKSHTQHKAVRFVTPSVHGTSQAPSQRAPLGDITEELAREAEEEDEDGVIPASPSPLRRRSVALDREIADSEDDFEILDENEDEDKTGPNEDEEYGAVGEETQRLVDEVVSSHEKLASSAAQMTPSPPLAHSETSAEVPESSAAAAGLRGSSSFSEVPTVRLSSPPQRLPPALEKVKASSFSEASTVRLGSAPQRLPPLSSFVPSSSQAGHAPEEPETEPELPAPAPPMKSQFDTQGIDSQRIPLDDIDAMGPQTDRSDVFVSIHSSQMEKIVSGAKNHEFRNYKIPNLVTRMWFYVTAPAAELRYMARISPAKKPGQIEDETAGVGNAEFNRSRSATRLAYQLLDVYQLNNPVPFEEMKEHGWVEGAPQRYTYVPPAVVGHLMANLRCSVWHGEEEEEEDSLDKMLGKPSSPAPAAAVTVSQEVTNQILSEATQHNTSDPVYIVPSSQESERRRTRASAAAAARRAGGSTPRVTRSSPRRPEVPMSTPYKRPTNPTPKRAAVYPSQATTVSQASSAPNSSPVKKERNSFPLPDIPDEESFVPPASSLHIRSSQLLSKSQMLPESLRSVEFSDLGDEVDIVYDSEGGMDVV